MKVPADEVRRRMERFEAVCRASGSKLTHQRFEIFREVARTDEHPDAAAVYGRVRRRVPSVSLDTVYRTLWLLVDLGLVDSMGPPRGRVRFDANTTRHHHFVCERCGLTKDIYCEGYDHLPIPREVTALGTVQATQVEIKGVCLKCSKENGLRPREQRRKEADDE